jgi:hypothetical protein
MHIQFGVAGCLAPFLQGWVACLKVPDRSLLALGCGARGASKFGHFIGHVMGQFASRGSVTKPIRLSPARDASDITLTTCL